MSTAGRGAAPHCFEGPWSEALLSRIEDASLNASAPPEQRWLDGWLLRLSPGQAKRARSVQAVAEGRMPLGERLAEAALAFRAAALPLLFRLTPFSRPPGLDAELAARGWRAHDHTRVMVQGLADAATRSRADSAEVSFEPAGAGDFAEAIGALRGSPAAQVAAHRDRLARAPVPFHAVLARRREDGAVVGAGQIAIESAIVGLFDVHVATSHRRRGLATAMCERLLSDARSRSATVAYLQVDAGNTAARAVYHRLGFADAYSYHYRAAPAAHGGVG